MFVFLKQEKNVLNMAQITNNLNMPENAKFILHLN